MILFVIFNSFLIIMILYIENKHNFFIFVHLLTADITVFKLSCYSDKKFIRNIPDIPRSPQSIWALTRI